MPAGETGWLEWYTGVMERYGLPHDVTITSPDPFLLQNHYVGDDGTDWYLFANASFGKPQDTDLIFDQPSAQALLYDPDEGVRYALDTKGDTLHLHLGPSETVLISLSDRVADAPRRDILPLPDPSAPALEAHWDVTLVNPQVEGLVSFSCTELPDLKDTHPSFMGTADYKTVVTLPSDAAQMPHLLHLGKVCDIAEVFVNGQPAGLRWWGDPVFDLSGLLRPGDNELEVKVTTQMCNYMRSLTDNSAARRFTFRRNHEPVSAGLLGPVTLY
jgi:hypothetical protein